MAVPSAKTTAYELNEPMRRLYLIAISGGCSASNEFAGGLQIPMPGCTLLLTVTALS